MISCTICPFLGHFNHENIRGHEKRRINQNVLLILIVTVPDTKTGIKRTFTVTNPDFVRLYRKNAALRPKHVANCRVFYRYKNKKCNAQVVGEIPSLLAKYLGLPNSKEYTVANSGADISVRKRQGRWKSVTVAES
jgi:hypothetical protein